MSNVIQQSELRNDNTAVMRRVAAGESFVVTVNGRPTADVVPHRRASGKRMFVAVAELAAAFESVGVADDTGLAQDLLAADEFFGADDITDPHEAES